jgi:hypothetical protein
MSEIKTNKKTGLEFLLIGKQKFNADKDGVFNMDLAAVKKILINELPLDRKCLIDNTLKLSQLTSPIISPSPVDIDLIFVRRNAGLVEITISEELYPGDLDLEITPEYFYILKESVLHTHKSLHPKIIKHLCNSEGQVSFEYSIELTSSTIGEAFLKAVNTNTTIENSIGNAVEKGTNCIRLVLEGAFQIDVSHIFSLKDKNSKV